jgi:hypothetical protein
MKKYPKIEDSYKYLTDMKIHSFSKDAIDTLNGKKDSLENEFIKIKNFELKDFWNNV